MLTLKFLGATGTVTGSKYLLRHGDDPVLVDCGLFQGYKQLRLRNWEPFPVLPAAIRGVVLTHAHLDHSGFLPVLVSEGFRGKVFCTEATRDLCRILLPDSGRLLEEEALYANRHNFSKHKPALPLYSEADALRALEHLVAVPVGHEFSPAPEMLGRFQLAGHILGAASVSLRCDGRTVMFSGDVGRPNDPIMRPPTAPGACDYLVVESTYGDRRHAPSDPAGQLADVISRTAARGGVTVIPAFAVGRAQELLYEIWKLKQAGAIPAALPVYLNSPMAVDATRLYIKHHDQHRLDERSCHALGQVAHIVNSVEESMALNRRQAPMVIIAASGMATGGRVLHHLKAFAGDSRNTILFAGFQAAGTRGARMLAGETSVKIHGEYFPVRARVELIGNLSAHADADEILDWLSQSPAAPRQVFVTHGEPAAADALRLRIAEQLHWPCRVPDYLDEVVLA
ncbi:MBL fold metallo-hydrolase RNA specificity domain-containing protein [Pseudoduganella violaceinigra]|uniref:MBL fold metallo-hydrolase RNA specificity domain-containing protein n=1 Tax=Pseudoduganella violaceinigra TaxID=246602 RepID=UPI000483D63C|nr:MBL fold metallo-hydrolase [Pseudoduganella violaceinigra]